MKATATFSHAFRYYILGGLGLAALSLVCEARAELLLERPQGGPNEYRTSYGRHIAGFELTEATRVTGISGYFTGFGEMYSLTMAIVPEEYSMVETDNLFPSITFYPSTEPHPGIPGVWVGAENLSWDLQPGRYALIFDGAGSGESEGITGVAMPLAYPYFGTTSAAREFDYFIEPYGDQFTGYPFGARIYGAALTAIPEPAQYGFAASFVLFAGILLYRRRGAMGPLVSLR
ncbi:MAG TPA: hypothetical protein VFT72_14020 [Opitutaceae bacterium]|nr:hypothetical protein [Opitutaceae bacterium]